MSEMKERLKRKLTTYYIQEREKGVDIVAAKYNATYYVLHYVLGMVEHFSEWEDLHSIKATLQHYRYLEMYAYDALSTQVLEREYQAFKTEDKTG